MVVLCWVIIVNSVFGIVQTSLNFKDNSTFKNILSYISYVFYLTASILFNFVSKEFAFIPVLVGLVAEFILLINNLKTYKEISGNKMDVLVKIISNILIIAFGIALTLVCILN